MTILTNATLAVAILTTLAIGHSASAQSVPSQRVTGYATYAMTADEMLEAVVAQLLNDPRMYASYRQWIDEGHFIGTFEDFALGAALATAPLDISSGY